MLILKIVYSFLLACNLGKNCQGVMECKEFQFFLKLIKDADDETEKGKDY